MRRPRRTVLALVTVLLDLVVLAGAAHTAVRAYTVAPFDATGSDGRLTLLVLGSDSGPPRPGSPLAGRADGFHIVSLSVDRQHAAIVSFPRDSWVPVAGQGTTKVNSCLSTGPDPCVATAQSLTGIEMDGYVLTSFQGFERAVDAIGGVTIDVEQRLLDISSHSDLQPGVQMLNGQQALSYVRDRHSRPNGDLDRAESHARFMQAAHTTLVGQDPSLFRIHELIAIFHATSVTTLGAADQLRLAATVLRIPPENIVRKRLDASLGTVGSASVVFLTEGAEATLADLRADGMLDGNS